MSTLCWKMRFALALLFASLCLGDPIAGPFKVRVERIEMCPPELPASVVHHIRFIRDRHDVNKYVFYGNITMSETQLADDHNADLRFASWSSRGGWKENAHVIKFPKVCTQVKTNAPKVYEDFTAALEGPSRNCPFPPGQYRVRNLTIDLSSTSLNHLPVFFYGKWRVRSTSFAASNPQKFKTCTYFTGSIIPK